MTDRGKLWEDVAVVPSLDVQSADLHCTSIPLSETQGSTTHTEIGRSEDMCQLENGNIRF